MSDFWLFLVIFDLFRQTLEREKKRFDLVLDNDEEKDFDPHKALYNKNMEIKNEFLKRFQRDLDIDAEVDSLQVDITAF